MQPYEPNSSQLFTLFACIPKSKARRLILERLLWEGRSISMTVLPRNIFSFLLDNKVLDLGPFLVSSCAISGMQLDLPDNILFVPSSSSNRLLNNICNQNLNLQEVVSFFMYKMNVLLKLTVVKVKAFQGKVYNSWIFLFNKVVLCKPLVVNDEIWRKLLTIKPMQLTPWFLSARLCSE